jgi:hypothetical protein
MKTLKIVGMLMMLFLAFQYGRVYDLGAKSKSAKELNKQGKITWYNGQLYYLISNDMDGNLQLSNEQLRDLYNVSNYETNVIIVNKELNY